MWTFPVLGDGGWKEAQVTVGGIYTGEVEARTMESKKNKGIYWAGEVLDVDGDCGGYNLQWRPAAEYWPDAARRRRHVYEKYAEIRRVVVKIGDIFPDL